ncbi:sphingosine N-acyltransferase lac1 [Hortaea werneckii]|nr:sphingosine N-acyltransferase lac1 [Hortaea werneckii]KAI7691908.1 sphingosine N-acyltransferase lac1 [Hortaea werneckii]
MARPAPTHTLQPPSMRQPYTPPPQQARESHATPGLEDVSFCASPADPRPVKRRKAKNDKPQQQDSLAEMLRKGIVDHQLGLSVNLMLFVGLSYVLFPSLRENMTAFFRLSYPSSEPGMYGQGSRDLYIVGSFIVFFTALRALCLDYLLLPLAGWCGIAKKKGRVRFAEQSYMMVYYALYWLWGVRLFAADTPEGVDSVNSLLISLWEGWPFLHLSAGMKLYYLSQSAFWIQQIVVLHLEERRKDHWQMLTHHFITVGLLAGSYPYRHWRVGNAVLVCMDLVDFIFPLAKILKYLEMQTACDMAFGAFVISWILSRHVCYMAICWSIYAHVAVVTMPYGLYSTKDSSRLSVNGGTNVVDNLLQPVLHPQAQTVSFNANIRWTFLGLLLALQCITLVWLVMIMRVVARVLRGEGADDTRSDDEGGEEEEEDLPAQPSDHTSVPISMSSSDKAQPRFIEVESTGEDFTTYPKRKGSSSKRRSKGISSGLNLGEHKDILNRIGCLSEEQLAREREKREGSMSPRPSSSTGRK